MITLYMCLNLVPFFKLFLFIYLTDLSYCSRSNVMIVSLLLSKEISFVYWSGALYRQKCHYCEITPTSNRNATIARSHPLFTKVHYCKITPTSYRNATIVRSHPLVIEPGFFLYIAEVKVYRCKSYTNNLPYSVQCEECMSLGPFMGY